MITSLFVCAGFVLSGSIVQAWTVPGLDASQTAALHLFSTTHVEAPPGYTLVAAYTSGPCRPNQYPEYEHKNVPNRFGHCALLRVYESKNGAMFETAQCANGSQGIRIKTPCESEPNACGERGSGFSLTVQGGRAGSYACDAVIPPATSCSNDTPVAPTPPQLRQCFIGFICQGNTVLFQDDLCHTRVYRTCGVGQLCVPVSGTCRPNDETEEVMIFDSNRTAPSVPAAVVAPGGHLTARPVLVRRGETSRLYWDTLNVESCKVFDDTGNILSTTLISGEDGVETTPILGRTVFTLSCVPDLGTLEQAVVNVVPQFQEF